MSWAEVIGLGSLLFAVTVIWFINIRWTVNFWRKQIQNKRINLDSKAPVQTAQYEYTNDGKEYSGVGLYPLNQENNTQNNKGCKKKDYSSLNSPTKIP